MPLPAPRIAAPAWNDTPRVTWHITGASLEDMLPLEAQVPGVRILSHHQDERRGAWPMRASKLLEKGFRAEGLPIMVAPLTAWWLAEDAALDRGLTLSEPHWRHPLEPWDPDEGQRLDARGAELFEDARARGLLASDFKPLRYQVRNLAWAADPRRPRPFNLIIWPTGSGKTKGAALEAGALNLPALVVCPGKARRPWEVQVPHVLGRRPFRHYPDSDWEVGTVGLEEYLHATAQGYEPPRVDRRDLRVVIYAEPPTRFEELHFVTDRLRSTVDVIGLGPLAPLVARAAEAGRCRSGSGVAAVGRELRLAAVDALYPTAAAGSGAAGGARPDVVIIFSGARPSADADYVAAASARAGIRVEHAAIGLLPQRPPFVIIGAESVAAALPVARRVNAGTVILDEIQIFGNPSRKQMRLDEEGNRIFSGKKTAGGADVQAAAIAEICHAQSVQHRIGISAMPVEAGLPRRLWAVGDLLDPGCFGGFRTAFAPRYCYNEQEPYHSYTGFLNDDGARFTDELKLRMTYCLHEVTYSESHGALPPTELEFPWLDRADLGTASAGIREARAVVAAGRDAADAGAFERLLADFDMSDASAGGEVDAGEGFGSLQERISLEVELAYACEAKLPWVRYQVIEALRDALRPREGAEPWPKVLVFVNRRRIADDWLGILRADVDRWLASDEVGGRLRRAAIGGGLLAAGRGAGTLYVDGAHGGVPYRDREEMVERFASHDGPALLVITQQAFGTAVDGLQVASRGICAAFPWRIAEFIQLKGRFDRIGGVRTLLSAPVASGTHDEVIVGRLAAQAGLVQGIHRAEELDGLGRRMLGMEDADLMQMTLAALGCG